MRKVIFALGCVILLGVGSHSFANLGDSSSDLVFTSVPPCRIIDTRVAGGVIAGGTQRNFMVAGTIGFEAQGGQAGGCGIPQDATSVVINFIAVDALGPGNLRAWPYGGSMPAHGSIINYASVPGLNIANGLVQPICDASVTACTSNMVVGANGQGAHLVADVTGYFTRFPTEQGGGVPSGFMILGDTSTSPPGYAYTGRVLYTGWASKTGMPTPRGSTTASVVNNRVYVIGGNNGPTVFSTNEEYDPVTNTWTARADMPTPRGSLAAAAVNSKIYALGGYNGSIGLATNEEYDPVANTWTAKPNMPTARWGHVAAVVNGKIYAIGGGDGYSLFGANEVYDPLANLWTLRASMPTGRWGLGGAVVNNKVYALGGYNGLNLTTNEEYDPGTNTWNSMSDMPTARQGLAAAGVNSKIYAIGGSNQSTIFATNEEYDPATNTWTARASMSTPRMYLVTAAVSNKIYAIGGTNGFYPAPAQYFGTNEEFDPGLLYLHRKN